MPNQAASKCNLTRRTELKTFLHVYHAKCLHVRVNDAMTDVFSSGFVFKVRYQMRPSVVKMMLVNEVNIKTKRK